MGSAHRLSEDSAGSLQALEIELLLEALFRRYGHDFREYATASLKRRILGILRSEGLETVSGLQERVLHDPACLERLLLALSVNVTSMFRDPSFFLAFRNAVVPFLRTYPFLRIWHAGCSTGEEVYSLAILLEEEGLLHRCLIYATDMNDSVLRRAREGIFPLDVVQGYAANYAEAGGRKALSDYYTAGYGNALFHGRLRDHAVFSLHNLAVDHSFNEFNVILCRNVMIYFQKALQKRVHHLLYDSLATFGILGIGIKETLQFTPHEMEYQALDGQVRLYRRTCRRQPAGGLEQC